MQGKELIDFDFAKLRQIADQDDVPDDGRFKIVSHDIYSCLRQIATTVAEYPEVAGYAIKKGIDFISNSKQNQWMFAILAADTVFEFDQKYCKQENSRRIIEAVLPVYEQDNISICASSVARLLNAGVTMGQCRTCYELVDFMTGGYFDHCHWAAEEYLSFLPQVMKLAEGSDERQSAVISRVATLFPDLEGARPDMEHVGNFIDMARHYPHHADQVFKVAANKSLAGPANAHKMALCKMMLDRAKDTPELMQAVLPAINNCIVNWAPAAPEFALQLGEQVSAAMSAYIGGDHQDVVCDSFMLLAKPDKAGADTLVVFGAEIEDTHIILNEPPGPPAQPMRGLTARANKMLEIGKIVTLAHETRDKGQLPTLVELVKTATPAPQ